jgi:hypothetical protein
MPILNRDNVVIGVAQIINKKTGTHEFIAKDINVNSFIEITKKKEICFRSSGII